MKLNHYFRFFHITILSFVFFTFKTFATENIDDRLKKLTLELIKNDDSNIDKYIEKAKDKDDPFRLMGFGHRVYKNFDPRAKIIKKAADQVLNDLGIDDPVLDIAKEIESKALNDPYFIEKKLYPNVDFYSGIIYRALGIPSEMFTVIFALGRIPGWIAQWKEMRESNNPIGRPRQVYNGPNERTIK